MAKEKNSIEVAETKTRTGKKPTLKQRVRKRIAKIYSLDSFVLTKLSNKKEADMFREIYREDYKETSNKGKELSAVQIAKANKQADAIIEKEKKRVCVITKKRGRLVENSNGSTRFRFEREPIGFVSFNVVPLEGMASHDLVLQAHRMFLREEVRGLSLASRIVLRALGRASLRSQGITHVVFKDPFLFDTPLVAKSMQAKGWLGEIEERRQRNDIKAEINLKALKEEEAVIRAYDSYKKHRFYRKPIDRIRLARTRTKYRKKREQRQQRLKAMKAITPKH